MTPGNREILRLDSSPTPGTIGFLVNNRKPALGFIFITLFIDILGIGLIIPVLPQLVRSFRGGDYEAASHTVGWLGAVYALMQFLFSPVLGSLSDQFGRRPVILLSLLGAGLDYLLLAFAPNLGWFFIGRVINGISGANITAASAYIADISPPEKRAANFGIIGAAFGLGFIAGPLMGGWLGHHNLRWPFIGAAVLALANWLYGFYVLPESLAPENRRRFSWGRSNPFGSLVALRRFPVVIGLTESLFLINLAQFSLHNIWVLYTGYRYHWNETDVGISLAIVGIMAAIVQGGLARKIIPALGEKRSIFIGLLVGTINMVGYGLATQGWMLYAILAIGSLGAIAGPALQGLVSRSVPANEQGAVQGALSGLSSVSMFLAPLIATNLFGYFISDRAPLILPGAPFFLSGLMMLVALFLAMRSLTRNPPPLSPAQPKA